MELGLVRQCSSLHIQLQRQGQEQLRWAHRHFSWERGSECKTTLLECLLLRLSKKAFTGIDHQYGWTSHQFATSGGSVVEVWDHNRADPINRSVSCLSCWFSSIQTRVYLVDLTYLFPTIRFEFGVDTVTSVKFNTVETEVFASTTVERAICLYDLRGTITKLKISEVCLSPWHTSVY